MLANAPPADSIVDPGPTPAVPLWLLPDHAVEAWLAELPAGAAAWARSHEFRGERGKVLVLPGSDGGVLGAALGLGALPSLAALSSWHVAGLPERLPAARYRLANALPPEVERLVVTGWLHGAYRFARYRASVNAVGRPQLQIADSPHRALALAHAAGCRQFATAVDPPR